MELAQLVLLYLSSFSGKTHPIVQHRKTGYRLRCSDSSAHNTSNQACLISHDHFAKPARSSSTEKLGIVSIVPMASEAEIFALVESGQAYLACERSLVIVRRLKRQNDLPRALLFLMYLAHALADKNLWEEAVTSAKRSLDLFPAKATSIQIVLKDLYLSFVDRATPAAATPDFFGFVDRLVQIFPGLSQTLLTKEAVLADAAGLFGRAQHYFLTLFAVWPNAERGPELRFFAAMIWRWIAAIPDENERRAQSQFVICRAAVALTGTSAKGPAFARELIELVKENCPEENKGILELPLVHFATFFVRAVIEKHDQTIGWLVDKYKNALDLEPDLPGVISRIRNKIRPPTGQGAGFDIGALVQNLFGRGAE
jgi:hypothetical protein